VTGLELRKIASISWLLGLWMLANTRFTHLPPSNCLTKSIREMRYYSMNW